VNGIAVFRDVDFQELARLTENYSGRDISIVCREAAMEPIRELQRSGRLDDEGEIFRVRPVSRDDFIHAIENIAPSTSPNEMKKYYDWGGGS
jgi:katanin p60 ATPase-containing subunit A1